MFLYGLQVIHQPKDSNYTAYKEFASWCVQDIQAGAWFLNRVIYSGEIAFHVNGKVNEHNVRILGTENPLDRR